MRRHYPLNANGAEDAGQLPWTDGVPETDTEGSYPGHSLFTDQEAEILNLQRAAGLVDSSTDLTQVLQAVARGGLWLSVLGGTANALAGTIQGSVVLPVLLKGVRFIGYPSSANTSAGVSLAITGIGSAANTAVFPVIKADGTALAAGDIKAGRRYEFEADGNGNLIITGGGISAGSSVAGQLFVATKSADQSLANTVQTAVTWNGTAPPFATWDGTKLTFTQACRCDIRVVNTVVISCANAGFAESDLALNINGQDTPTAKLFTFNTSNTTLYLTPQRADIFDFLVGDQLKVTVGAQSSTFNAALIQASAYNFFKVLRLS